MKSKFLQSYQVIFAVMLFVIACSKESSPELKVSDIALTFTTYPKTKTMVISNKGDGELSWEITNIPNWISLSKNSGKITSNVDTLKVTANINQAIGTYSGTFSINSNGGNKDITVSLTIGNWQEQVPMKIKRGACGVVEKDGKIYVIGGLKTEDIALPNVEVYDPVTDLWIEKAPMPTARGDFGCVIVDGKIYAIGGINPDITDVVEVYDPANDSWTTKTPLPSPRGHVTASAVGTKIYVIGGSKQIGEIWSGLNTVEEYDIQTDSWTTKQNMPSSRWSLSSCVVDGKIYAIGGNQYPNQPTVVGNVEEYDPAEDTWISKNPMPTARYSLSCSLVNDKIYAIGGWSSSALGPLYSNVEEYDPETDTWQAKSGLPFKIALLSTCTVNGKIYAIGGTGTVHPFEMTSNIFLYEPGNDQ